MINKEIFIETGSKMAQYLDLQVETLLASHSAETAHKALVFAMTTNLLILVKRHGNSIDDLCTILKDLAKEFDGIFEDHEESDETIH